MILLHIFFTAVMWGFLLGALFFVAWMLALNNYISACFHWVMCWCFRALALIPAAGLAPPVYEIIEEDIYNHSNLPLDWAIVAIKWTPWVVFSVNVLWTWGWYEIARKAAKEQWVIEGKEEAFEKQRIARRRGKNWP